MKFLNKKSITTLLSVLALLSCSTETIVTTPKDSSEITVIQNKSSNPDFELLIEQKKNNGELMPIGSKGVGSVSLNGFDYPVNKLVQDQSIIQIPNLVAGKHDLKVSLYLVKDELKIPLIIPNIGQKVFVILRLTINETLREIERIEYGYDLDRNGIIDTNAARFESNNNKIFYAISTTGIKTRIDTEIAANGSIPDQDVTPPGVVPQTDTVIQTQPQILLPDPPKPVTGNLELYPLPPGASRLPDPPNPLPPEVEKKPNQDNNP